MIVSASSKMVCMTISTEGQASFTFVAVSIPDMPGRSASSKRTSGMGKVPSRSRAASAEP